jgi:8-oxo-dGTP diphosphatase
MAARAVAPSIDTVVLTAREGRLAVLLTRSPSRSRERWQLPWQPLRPANTIEQAAAQVARRVVGALPGLIEQVAAFGDRRRHPSHADLSVAFLAVTESAGPLPGSGENAWFPVDELPPLAPRQRAMLDGVLTSVRMRLDLAPIAFRLVPRTFTLTQLQETYELLLGRRLHKASFRRSLHAAWLVEPMDEWRSEGRGRPAQLFRYAPRRRRAGRRGVHFQS